MRFRRVLLFRVACAAILAAPRIGSHDIVMIEETVADGAVMGNFPAHRAGFVQHCQPCLL
jgi:hypothetical protein